MGHLVLVPPDESHPPVGEFYYLPHHGVLKESSTTTKLRVVFDGSAVTPTGVSLNDNLLVGPRIQDEIFKIMIRFRFHLIGITGDCTKMYRQIGLHEKAQDFHRLIWRDSKDQSLSVYRMTRVTYGVASSSYHAIRALQTAANYTNDPETLSALKSDFYVDDFLGGAESIIDASSLHTNLTEALSHVQMPIRKWT